MPVVFDGSVSGSSSASLGGGVHVIFWSFDLTTAGEDVRHTPPFSVDHLLRVGFIALGDNFDGGVGTAFDHWQEPHWINYEHTMWLPEPALDGGGTVLTQFASLVRWSLSPGTEGWLHVFAA
jgi:hypothetical protein